MWRDPIVEEVRAIRAAIAKEHGNDLKALARALRRKKAPTAGESSTSAEKAD